MKKLYEDVFETDELDRIHLAVKAISGGNVFVYMASMLGTLLLMALSEGFRRIKEFFKKMF